MHIDSWQQVTVLALILGYLVYRSHRGARKVKQVEKEVTTANAGVAAVSEGVTQVLHQVENNSGTSLKDAVDRIETGQAELVNLVGDHVKLFGDHVEDSKKDSERLAALEQKYLNPE
jgi:predicted secreted acid phosphatase